MMILPPRRAAGQRMNELKLAVLENDKPVGPIIRDTVAMWQIFGVTVYDGVSAAFLGIRSSSPDILFINGNGSRFDAAAVTRTIRDPRGFPNPFLAIVVVLSEVTRSKVLKARDAGADEFLAFPFAPKSLYERISSIVLDRRGFVSTKDYFGPDRRRGAMAQFLGANRRRTPSMLIDPKTGETYRDAG